MNDEATTVDEATLARVEETLKADIAWAVEHGPGWEPLMGASYSDGRWGRDGCAVCAIGAHVVRTQPPAPPVVMAAPFPKSVVRAAESIGVPAGWLTAVYFAVAENGGANPQAGALARRLRAYGDSLADAKRGAR